MSILNIGTNFSGIQWSVPDADHNYQQTVVPRSSLLVWKDVQQKLPPSPGFQYEYFYPSYLTNGA